MKKETSLLGGVNLLQRMKNLLQRIQNVLQRIKDALIRIKSVMLKWIKNLSQAISKILQMLKAFFQPKVLRLLALGLTLLASLLLLLQYNYGSHYLVTMGTISWDGESKVAEIDALASHPIQAQRVITVSASKILLRSLEKAGPDAEFVVVLHQRGEKLVFERIHLLTPPEAEKIQGPNWRRGRHYSLVVGTQPELVEMVGLDKYGYRLKLPNWVQRKIPDANLVYYQEGMLDEAKAVLDGESDYQPDIFILNDKLEMVGMRTTAGKFWTLPEVLRLATLCLYGAAIVSGLASLLVYKWSALCNAGKRIWDQVSMRVRKASN